MMPGNLPHRYKLLKREIRQIADVLSRVPRTSPEITIKPYTGQEFTVERQEVTDLSVPLAPEMSGLQVQYGAVDGEQLEASCVRVTRNVRALGMWCLDIYRTGGSFIDGKFNIVWYDRSFVHVGRNHFIRICELSDIQWCEPKHLEKGDKVTWLDVSSAQGSDDLDGAVGYAVVNVGDRDFDCIRSFKLYLDEPDDITSKWQSLHDTYTNKDGRDILTRVYSTVQHMKEYKLNNDVCITYNGTKFYHWFDQLSDVTLDPDSLLINQIIKQRST